MTVLIDATPSYVSFNDGDFDSRYRYIRKISVTSSFEVIRGPTWGVLYLTGSNGSSDGINLTYDIPSRNFFKMLNNSSVSIDVGNNISAPLAGNALDLSPVDGISISDPATGRLLFDKTQPLMHVISELNGSKFFASANPTGAQVVLVKTHDLGAADPVATDVVGAINMVYDAPSSVVFAPVGVTSDDWWSINGTYIVHWQYGSLGVGAARNQVISGSPASSICGISHMTFRVSTASDSVGVGRIVMDEYTLLFKLFAGGQWNPEGGGSVAAYIRPAYTLNYKLKAVAFS